MADCGSTGAVASGNDWVSLHLLKLQDPEMHSFCVSRKMHAFCVLGLCLWVAENVNILQIHY